jgi:hypothetical protein
MTGSVKEELRAIFALSLLITIVALFNSVLGCTFSCCHRQPPMAQQQELAPVQATTMQPVVASGVVVSSPTVTKENPAFAQ